MADEGSREWVSPHYMTPGHIFILNRSNDLVAVTLRFYGSFFPGKGESELFDEVKKNVHPRKSEPFVSHEGAGYQKWVHVSATGNVYPWGVTPVKSLFYYETEYGAPGFVHMSFFPVVGRARKSG
jgi:hypothetical protein